EVDTRLRPSGAQGPIAVSLDAFDRYQHESAWTWEHMALARARVLHGPAEGRQALQDVIRGVLEMSRDPAKLRSDALEMRENMARHKSAKGPLDVKLARGGLVDIEFITHYLQLRDHVALVPAIPDALAELVEAGLLPHGIRAAHRALARFLVAARLLMPDGETPPDSARLVLASACECADWTCLTDILTESRQVVATAWAATFGEQLEIAS
ncbi:MAG: glutamine-synthetase adenylyltransferase, partial [Sphingomonadales bacterium]|nr:glutamine-synthetase adenylyltransferase [Sphingomonadales bacterium]